MHEAILVFGGRRGSRHVWDRLAAAAELANSKSVPLIVTGGNTEGGKANRFSDFSNTEAATMVQTLRGLGVTQRVYGEHLSQETIGNVALAGVALGSLKVKRITLVTSDSHAYRVRLLANHLYAGLEITDRPVWHQSSAENLLGRITKELRGLSYVDRLRSDVAEGDIRGAFEWVKRNHERQPYEGLTWQQAEAIIKREANSLWPQMYGSAFRHRPTDRNSTLPFNGLSI